MNIKLTSDIKLTMVNTSLLGFKVVEDGNELSLIFKTKEVVWWERKVEKLAKDGVLLQKPTIGKDRIVYYVFKLGLFVDSLKALSNDLNLHLDVTLLKRGTFSKKKLSEVFCTYGHKHEKKRGELYVALKNSCMLELYDPKKDKTVFLSLEEGSQAFIHPKFYHRLVAGNKDCLVLGVVPKDAGHDYEVVKRKGFPYHVIDDTGNNKKNFL